VKELSGIVHGCSGKRRLLVGLSRSINGDGENIVSLMRDYRKKVWPSARVAALIGMANVACNGSLSSNVAPGKLENVGLIVDFGIL
jgi:hypothetical protein